MVTAFPQSYSSALNSNHPRNNNSNNNSSNNNNSNNMMNSSNNTDDEKNSAMMEDSSTSSTMGLLASKPLIYKGVACAPSYQGSLPAIPSHWSTKDKWVLLDVPPLSQFRKVVYQGPGKTDNDAAAIRSENPVPSEGCALYYFEIRVVNAGQSGYIGVGLCGSQVSLNRLPGWERNSFGYHGDDGNAFRDSGTGKKYGPPFTTGDVVGCCWNMMDNTIFFTKNGLALGIAFQNVRNANAGSVLYPCIGLRTIGEVIEVNFGQDPFRFDIEAFAREERDKYMSFIKEDCVYKIDSSLYDVTTQTILDYLMHNGFVETARLFARDTGGGDSLKMDVSKVIERKEISQKVLDGDIDKAIEEASRLYPQMFIEDKKVLFELRCQKFIELVRNDSLEETVKFGQHHFREYQLKKDQDSDYMNSRLQEVFSLLAYEDPVTSPMAYLMNLSRRENVASILNGSILAAQKKARISNLHKIVAHARVTLNENAASGQGPTSLVEIEDFM